MSISRTISFNLAKYASILYTLPYGTLAEWSNAEACKALQPWVRIPQVPDLKTILHNILSLFFSKSFFQLLIL